MAGAATELWNRLGERGLDRLTVARHKLLARKRPHLLPIYDRVALKVLSAPERTWWEPWWKALAQNPDIVERLEELRREVDVASHLSLLRVADIVIWMRNRHP